MPDQERDTSATGRKKAPTPPVQANDELPPVEINAEVRAFFDAEEAKVTELTRVQVFAAELLGRTGDPSAVERAYGLPEGRVMEWFRDDDRFRAGAGQEYVRRLKYTEPICDPVAGLNGRQLRAAKLMASGDMTDVQVAKAVGVADRTIRLWKSQPLFQQALAAMREGMPVRVSLVPPADPDPDPYQHLKAKLLERTEDALDEGDTKSVLELVKALGLIRR